MPAGYSRRRLVEKLDMKPGARAHLRGSPAGHLELLASLPDGVVVRRSLCGPIDFPQAFDTGSGLELMARRADRRQGAA